MLEDQFGEDWVLSTVQSRARYCMEKGVGRRELEKWGRRQRMEDHLAAELVLQGAEKSITRSTNGGCCSQFYHLGVEGPVENDCSPR